MANLKRYDPCNERMGRTLVPGMTETKGGVYVKFEDIKEYLPSTSTNTTKATIALAETYRDNFLKRSSLYNIMSGFVEWLKEQQ